MAQIIKQINYDTLSAIFHKKEIVSKSLPIRYNERDVIEYDNVDYNKSFNDKLDEYLKTIEKNISISKESHLGLALKTFIKSKNVPTKNTNYRREQVGVVNTNGLLDYYNGVIRRRLGANEDISNDVLTRLLLFNTLSRWSYANSPINPHPKNPNSDRRSAAVIFAADPTECSMPFLTTDHKALGHGELFRILFFGDSLDNAQPKFDKQGNNKPNSSQTSEDTSSFFHGGFRRKKFTKRRRRTTKKRKTRFLR